MVKTEHVIILIEKLAEETGQSLDYPGFGAMSEKIDNNFISQKYLDDLYRNMKLKAKNNKQFTRPSRYYLDIISKHLQYSGFKHFCDVYDNPVSDELKSCFGNWWSYVRSNSGQYILKAPVKIYLNEKNLQVMMDLQGGERLFSGPIEEGAGCIYAYLKSKSGKQLGLVFKLGTIKRISVLQGTFCGISSAATPIGGREILVKEPDLRFEEMEWSRHPLNDESIDARIRTYFDEKDKNCIKISVPSNYDMDDLIIN